MKPLSLRAWLGLSHLVVLALPVLTVLLFGVVARQLEMEARGQLVHQGEAIAALSAARMARADPSELEELRTEIGQIARSTRTGVRLLNPDGTVLVEPELAPPPRRGGRLGPAVSVLTLVQHEGESVGAVVLEMAVRSPWLVASVSRWRLVLAGGGALVAALLLSLALAHRISAPLRGLSGTARAVRGGDLRELEVLAARRSSRVREVGELAEDLGEMAARLRERLVYIGEFASNVSHELKTPVTTLRSTLELLRDEPDLPDEVQDRFVRNGLDELARVDRTVTGLLALARAEEGGEGERLGLDQLVLETGERYPDISVVTGGGSVRANPAQLALALDNLVDNARHHGGGAVLVRAWRDRDLVGIDVEDDGVGISADNLPRVFERFFTTAGDRGRTGLGLPLVRAICRAHGGDVTVQSEPGCTRFRLAWPADS